MGDWPADDDIFFTEIQKTALTKLNAFLCITLPAAFLPSIFQKRLESESVSSWQFCSIWDDSHFPAHVNNTPDRQTVVPDHKFVVALVGVRCRPLNGASQG